MQMFFVLLRDQNSNGFKSWNFRQFFIKQITSPLVFFDNCFFQALTTWLAWLDSWLWLDLNFDAVLRGTCATQKVEPRTQSKREDCFYKHQSLQLVCLLSRGQTEVQWHTKPSALHQFFERNYIWCQTLSDLKSMFCQKSEDMT